MSTKDKLFLGWVNGVSMTIYYSTHSAKIFAPKICPTLQEYKNLSRITALGL